MFYVFCVKFDTFFVYIIHEISLYIVKQTKIYLLCKGERYRVFFTIL